MKTQRETQSETIPDPNFVRTLPAVKLPPFKEEVYPHIFMVEQPKHSVSEEQFERGTESSKKDVRFRRGRQIALMISAYFWVTDTHEAIF